MLLLNSKNAFLKALPIGLIAKTFLKSQTERFFFLDKLHGEEIQRLANGAQSKLLRKTQAAPFDFYCNRKKHHVKMISSICFICAIFRKNNQINKRYADNEKPQINRT
jgi:hypothetical protein